jgi:hypothetical protein
MQLARGTVPAVSGGDGSVFLEGAWVLGRSRRGEGAAVYAYHEAKRLGGLVKVVPGDLGNEIEVRLGPVCHVKGRLSSTGLKALGVPLEWTNVYVKWEEHRPFRCMSDNQGFEFYLPAGKYKLHAYGTSTYSRDCYACK